jgi:hypothetical protein
MPALSSADISHYCYTNPCSKHLTFQTRRITANAVIVLPSKIAPPPCTQGISLSCAVYGISVVLACKNTKKNWKTKRFVAKNFKKNPKDWILCEKLQSLPQKRKHFPPTEQKSRTIILDLV